MKSLITWLLILTTPFSAVAAPTKTQVLPETVDLVNEYLVEFGTKQKDLAVGIAQKEYMQAIADQFAQLEPADFNFLILYLIDRYVKQPTLRGPIAGLIQALRGAVAADLANTRQLEQGPASFIVEGTYTNFVQIILVGAISWRTLMLTPMRNAAFVARMKQIELNAMTKGGFRKAGVRIVANPITAAVTAGAIYGYVDYLLQSNSAHRLDPLDILAVVQTQLACQVSYKGLSLQEQVDKMPTDEEPFKKIYPQLWKDLQEADDTTAMLLEQFPRLYNLDVKDPLFQKALSKIPPAKDWQAYRSQLSDAETSKDGQCRQVALTYLKMNLESMISTVRETHDRFLPPVDSSFRGPR